MRLLFAVFILSISSFSFGEFYPTRITIHQTQGIGTKTVEEAIHDMTPRHRDFVKKGYQEVSSTGLPIAYHYVVDGKGHWKSTRELSEKGSHHGGYNSISIGIAMVGTFYNYSPTLQQYLYTAYLIAKIEAELGRKMEIVGHHEQIPGYNETNSYFDNCPGRLNDIDFIRGLVDLRRMNEWLRI